MPPVSVLVKPASSACNMDCSYCFYKDEANNRNEYFYGMMSVECAHALIKKAFDFASGSCSFMFQGGEPTLRGLDFFKTFVELQNKYKKDGVQVYNSIQTNGLLIDDEWAQFLSENNFLTGLSLDGGASVHNAERKDLNGEGTFHRVTAAADALTRHGAPFNILCVVTDKNAKSAVKIYEFFKKHGFNNLQFIPCLEPLKSEKSSRFHGLSPSAYADFSVKLFNAWFNDFKQGKYVSIRHIDNFVNMALGRPPESCAMRGRCGIQFATESNGDVYPCDFYVLDEYKLGNIFTDDFFALAASPQAKSFMEQSLIVPDECKKCKFYSFCRCGCRRERLLPDGRNRFCESYKEFFSRCGKKIYLAADILKKRPPES